MTGRMLLCASAVALVLAVPACAQFEGMWTTNLGRMHLEQEGDRIHGDYERNGGRLEGDVGGRTFEGIWAEDTADHRCRDKRMDSHYWGHFRIDFDENGKVFHGWRSACDGDLASGGYWTGSRVRPGD